MSESMLDVGVDTGSVGAKVVVLDREGNILRDIYRRIHGRPVQTTIQILEELIDRYGGRLRRIVFTGSAGKLMARQMNATFVNEIVAQARAEAEYYPHVRTIIEVGGEESKLIQLKEEEGRTVVDDFAMNSICAAGTGSFLDQQANRIGINIEGEFSELAMKSETPPRIAGRCTVFAKSDMIHLQQKATPVHDIIAGLCFALARNFKSNLARGREFVKPIAFQGGVSCNEGVVRAFTDVLELESGELIIPEHRTAMGAIGAVLNLRDSGKDSPFPGIEPLREFLKQKPPALRRHPRLPRFECHHLGGGVLREALLDLTELRRGLLELPLLSERPRERKRRLRLGLEARGGGLVVFDGLVQLALLLGHPAEYEQGEGVLPAPAHRRAGLVGPAREPREDRLAERGLVLGDPRRDDPLELKVEREQLVLFGVGAANGCGQLQDVPERQGLLHCPGGYDADFGCHWVPSGGNLSTHKNTDARADSQGKNARSLGPGCMTVAAHTGRPVPCRRCRPCLVVAVAPALRLAE